MKTDVLIVVDNVFREYFGLYLLRKYLSDRGLRVQFCNRFVVRTAFNKYKPTAVILPNCIIDIIPQLHERAFVFVLPSESGNGQPELMAQLVDGDKNAPTFLEHVDLLFSWGKKMSQLFINSHRLSADKIFDTGSPATDHWFLKQPLHPDGKIGLTTSLRALTDFDDPAFFLYRTEKVGERAFFLRPRHSEAWVYYEASLLRVLTELVIDQFSKHPRVTSLRVHPFERLKTYNYIKEECGNKFEIQKGGPISNWLKDIRILFSFMSGSMLDAYMMGVPVVSIKNLLDPHALEAIPPYFIYEYDQYFYHPESFTEAMDLARMDPARVREKTNTAKLDQFMNDNFTAHRQKPAAFAIAKQVAEYVQNQTPRSFKPLNTGRVPKVFNLSPTLETGVRFATAKVVGKTHPIYFTHLPWKVSDHADSKTAAESVYRINHHP